MTRGIVVAAALAALVACKKADAPAATGSAASGSAPAQPVAIDAAPPPVAVDAPAAAPVLTKAGLSVLADYKRGDMSDEDSVAWIQKRLPDDKVSFEVMDIGEREEGYYSVKRGETEVAQLVRAENGTLETRVLGAFATDDGFTVGKTAADLFAKHPDAACAIHDDSALGSLQCETGGFIYVLDGTNYKGPKKGKLAAKIVAALPVFIIATPQTVVP